MQQPVLVENGLSDAMRACTLYPNAGLYSAARAFAVCHDRAIQYLEQAPVLVLGALPAGKRMGRTSELYVAHKLVPLCEQGAPLKVVMRAFGFPAPLRRLRPYALFPSAGPVVGRLAKLDPSLLGRIIPEKPGLQRRWLLALQGWSARLELHRRPKDTHFAWAAEALATGQVGRQAASDMADFASAPDARFNPAWGWSRALEEAGRWHATLRAGQVLRGTPLTPTTEIDLASHPSECIVEGYRFLALRTPGEIIEEGVAMRHCVASYVHPVVRGDSHIIGIQRDGQRIATLELDRTWAIRQCKGKANATPRQEVLRAASSYAALVRRQQRGAP